MTRENAAAGRILLVDYDELCAAPEAGLTRIFAHCDLPATGEQIAELAADLAAGDNYAQTFDAQALAMIADQTATLHLEFDRYGGHPSARLNNWSLGIRRVTRCAWSALKPEQAIW